MSFTETWFTTQPRGACPWYARPALLAIDGVARELVVDRAGAGLFAEPENPVAIADAILRLADNADLRQQMGERGRAYVLQNLTRERLAARYLEVMSALVQRHRRS